MMSILHAGKALLSEHADGIENLYFTHSAHRSVCPLLGSKTTNKKWMSQCLGTNAYGLN